MSLTKEECVKARDIIFSYINADEMSVDEFNDSVVIFNELIEERFELLKSYEMAMNDLNRHWEIEYDNPPLKFEELKENMWVWDNKNQLYVQIEEDFDENGIIVLRYYEDSYNSNCERTRFEENRFYRYEVKE